jgi:hypothetical protein
LTVDQQPLPGRSSEGRSLRGGGVDIAARCRQGAVTGQAPMPRSRGDIGQYRGVRNANAAGALERRFGAACQPPATGRIDFGAGVP